MPDSCSEMEELDCGRPGEKRRRSVYGELLIPFAHHFTKHFYILNAFNPQKKKRSCQVDIIIPTLPTRKPVQSDLPDRTIW